MDVLIKVSDHAYDRLKERSGINKKACQKTAERAFTRGINHNETKGNLHKFISSTSRNSPKHNKIKLYGDKIFIFAPLKDTNEKGYMLVTVMQIPVNLLKLTAAAKDKKLSKKPR